MWFTHNITWIQVIDSLLSIDGEPSILFKASRILLLTKYLR